MKATNRATGGVSAPTGRYVGALVSLLVCGAVGLGQSLPMPSPDKVYVEDVIPQGNRTVTTGRIMSIIKTHPGVEYKREVVEEDIRKLYATKAFAVVRLVLKPNPTDSSRVVVYFQFRELPSVVSEVKYEGAKHFKQEELDTLTGIRKGVPLNPVANRQACLAILDKCHENGRLLASVDLVEGGQFGDTRVVFNITEGPKVKVKSIDVTGVEFVSNARLKTQINSSSMFLGIMLGDYKPMMADQDVVELEKYYRTFGFHDVRVNREVQPVGLRYVRLIYHVQEGKRYQVGHVDVSPSASMPHDQLMGLNKLEPGKFYDENKSQTTELLIKAAFGFRGREAMTKESLTFPENKPGIVDVFYEVEERPPAKVGQIIIYGNDVTRENVIRRQIPLYPGQTLTYPDLRAAEANLARLNIFDNNPEQGIHPTVSVIDPDSPTEYKDILVKVQETATGSLLFGVGVNSDAGLTGSIVLNERNFDIFRPPTSIDDLLSGHAFRGAGEEFRVEAVPGTQLQRYTVSFREPFLFDSPYFLALSGYFYDRVFNEYTEERVGFRATVGRQLNKYWSANVGFRVEDVGVHNVPFFAPQVFQDEEGQHFLFGLRAGVTRDSRDSILRATAGSLVDLSFEEVLGDFNFPVFNLEANKYWTVYQRADGSGRHVLAARSQLSIEGSEAPVYERFYAGGFRSMRGFEFRGVGPDTNGFKTGGDFMFLNSLEYQIPVKSNDGIYFVGFLDSGTVEDHITLDNYRVSAGVGVRVVVPMLGPVPIALDFGFPIVKAPADNTQVFSFWVGFFH
ncbi:MAG TPA: outer membrane protein assembly factor BamA [Gemmataceae bacterium]|nr:outer membrane protein assembly factor BamA [Gemmataceae bacterium]